MLAQRASLVAFAASVALLGVAVTMERASTQTKPGPSDGWTIHIDAKKHFGDAHPNEIAHHWCKNVAGMTECQIYDSDAVDAHLVAVETIVDPQMHRSFSPQEQAQWHFHRDEIPKVDAVMPDLSPADAKALTAKIENTYGKVWVLWDPQSSAQPIGQPSITILK